MIIEEERITLKVSKKQLSLIKKAPKTLENSAVI